MRLKGKKGDLIQVLILLNFLVKSKTSELNYLIKKIATNISSIVFFLLLLLHLVISFLCSSFSTKIWMKYYNIWSWTHCRYDYKLCIHRWIERVTHVRSHLTNIFVLCAHLVERCEMLLIFNNDNFNNKWNSDSIFKMFDETEPNGSKINHKNNT